MIAPGFEDNAIEELKTKKNLRILALENVTNKVKGFDYKHITGGLLVQEKDFVGEIKLENKGELELNAEDKKELEFAWKIVKHVKSNAIVLAKDGATIGIGAGQMSRVDSVELAIKKALGREEFSVMASDGFFPFPDSIQIAAEHKINAIIDPGGSIKDNEVIAEANKQGIALVFTGVRHFKH